MALKINYENISGRKRKLYSLLRPLEIKLTQKGVSLVPPFIQTYHLTLFTLFFALLMLASAFWAKGNLN